MGTVQRKKGTQRLKVILKQHTFQCFLVGNPVTFPSPRVLVSISVILPSPNFPLSPVFLLSSGLIGVLFKLSKELLELCGGVAAPEGFTTLRGASVGLRTAGIYNGDFIGRS